MAQPANHLPETSGNTPGGNTSPVRATTDITNWQCPNMDCGIINRSATESFLATEGCVYCRDRVDPAFRANLIDKGTIPINKIQTTADAKLAAIRTKKEGFLKEIAAGA